MREFIVNLSHKKGTVAEEKPYKFPPKKALQHCNCSFNEDTLTLYMLPQRRHFNTRVKLRGHYFLK